MAVLRFTLLFLIACIFSHKALSQSVAPKALAAAIDTIAVLIENHYVFPAKGKAIAQLLRQHHKKGSYASVKTWKDVDAVLTKDLQKFSNDGHLYLGYDPQVVKSLLQPSQEDHAMDSAEGLQKAQASNFGFREVRIHEGNVGYMRIDKIDISGKSLPQLYAAMQFVHHTKALIIDLRNNGGGGSDIGPVLESFFLPENQPLLQFRSRTGESTVERTVGWLTKGRYNKPLYILVNKKTASAAEAFAYALQYYKRAVIVGEGSAGAANMNTWYPVNPYIYLSVSTAAPTIPETDLTWEQKGLQPDIVTKAGEELTVLLERLQKKY